MTNRFSFKKTAIIISAALLFTAAGIPGVSAVTAWALPSSGVVIGDGINVRSSAEYGDVIDTLEEGANVSITDSMSDSEDMTWYKVEYTTSDGDHSGWVRGDLLEVSDDDSAAEEQTTDEAAQAAATQEQNTEETTAAADTTVQSNQPVAASSGDITYVIASSIPSDVVPDGFQQTTVIYEGENVPALVMNNAEVYLLYMEDQSNTATGRLVVYDMEKSQIIPYISFDTTNGFILLLNIPDAELSSVSDRFVQTTCKFEDGTMDALQMSQADSIISESADLQDFYYMYGVNRDGMYGWYTYDMEEGTIQESILSMHYNLNGTQVDMEEENSGFSLDSLSMVVIVGIIVVILLLVILVIIFGLRYRQLAKEKSAKKNNRPPTDKKGSGSSQRRTEYRDTSSKARPEAPRAETSKTVRDYDLSDGMNKDGNVSKDGYAMPTEPQQRTRTVRQPEKHNTSDDDDDLEFL